MICHNCKSEKLRVKEDRKELHNGYAIVKTTICLTCGAEVDKHTDEFTHPLHRPSPPPKEIGPE